MLLMNLPGNLIPPQTPIYPPRWPQPQPPILPGQPFPGWQPPQYPPGLQQQQVFPQQTYMIEGPITINVESLKVATD